MVKSMGAFPDDQAGSTLWCLSRVIAALIVFHLAPYSSYNNILMGVYFWKDNIYSKL